MRKWQKPIVIALSVLLFAAMIATLFLSSKAIDALLRAECFKKLQQTSTQIAADLYDDVVMDRSMLRVIAAGIAAQGDADDAALAKAMSAFDVSASYVSYLEYLRADGTLLHQSGARPDASGALDFVDEANKAPYISGKSVGIYDPNDYVLRVAVPAIRDGETIGILYGVVSLSDLAAAYKPYVYDGEAYVYIEDGDTGDFLLDTWHKSLGNISSMGARTAMAGFDFSQAEHNLRAGVSGYIGFASQTTGENLYMNYVPSGINNWNVIVTVEERVALAQARQINERLTISVIIAAGILLAFAAIIMLIMAQTNRVIRRLGLEDQTTKLPNRNAYDSFVKESREKRFAAISCVFADVNGLHEINNTHGHDAGDQMLRCVADALKQAFRGERVYRIGGDEFVVFTEALGPEDAWKRMEDAARALEAQSYSLSFGVAHREREQGLDRLIHEADEKMLINKRLYYEAHSRRKRL